MKSSSSSYHAVPYTNSAPLVPIVDGPQGALLVIRVNWKPTLGVALVGMAVVKMTHDFLISSQCRDRKAVQSE